MLDGALAERVPIGIHLHQAGGVEFANAPAALQAGVRLFESSAEDLEGVRISKAKGNIATEKLVGMLHKMGYATGIDLQLMERCAVAAQKIQIDHASPECSIAGRG